MRLAPQEGQDALEAAPGVAHGAWNRRVRPSSGSMSSRCRSLGRTGRSHPSQTSPSPKPSHVDVGSMPGRSRAASFSATRCEAGNVDGPRLHHAGVSTVLHRGLEVVERERLEEEGHVAHRLQRGLVVVGWPNPETKSTRA